MEKFDVIVVGGGLSGTCAAIAAARNGAKVLLCEKGNSLGGAAVNALVNPFMPYSTKINGENTDLSAGLFNEIIERLKEFNAVTDKACKTFNEEYLKIVLNRMCKEAGVTLLYHAFFTGAKVEQNSIKTVSFALKGGIYEFSAKYFIDATGDADVAQSAGFPTRLGREKDGLCQPMTLCFRLNGVDVKAFLKNIKKINETYAKFREEGKIKNPRETVLVFETLTDDILHFNTTRICMKNPVNPFDLTEAEIEAREQVLEMLDFLRANFKCCKNAELLSTAADIGVRESRMIDGEYILSESDIVACTKFSDSIAAGNYEIDIHNPEGTGTSHYFFKPGTYYTIPYRCLVPKGALNLLVAGRCASFTHEAQASCRIMPICATLGHAAGTATAFALKDNCGVLDVDIKKLQERLKEEKAFL